MVLDNPLSLDFRVLSQTVKPYMLPLLRRLLPDGRQEGHEYVALNPTRQDRRYGSFRINIHTGKWADFAVGDKGGDLISLWAYVRNIKQIEAAKELQSIMGQSRAVKSSSGKGTENS